MTKRQRLESLVLSTLAAMGKTAKSCDLWPAQGAWRSCRKLDVYRFEGQVFEGGYMRTIVSWNTMTDLLRSGITLEWENGEWMVNPKKQNKRVTAKSSVA